MTTKMTFGEGMVDLLRRSILVQSTLTLAFVVTACILWSKGMALPDDLKSMLLIVISFWMGSKTQHVIESGTLR